MTTQLELPVRTGTPHRTAVPAPVALSPFAALRASLRHRRAHRSQLARAIPSYPATRSALVLPVVR